MSEFIYKDYIPANARVIVDYTKEEKVKFSYPLEWTYWKAVRKNGFKTIFLFWMSLHMFIINLLRPILLFVLIGLFLYPLFYPRVEEVTATNYIDFKHITLPALAGVFYVIGIPFLVTAWLALSKERMAKWIPLIGYWMGMLSFDLKEKRFINKDIQDNKAIIPVFDNVFLDYKASGDFNEYLEKVEILEIPFSFIRRSNRFPFKWKKIDNDDIFRAVFYFSEEPKGGCLDVKFI